MASPNEFQEGDVIVVNKEINLYTFNKSKKLNIYPQVKGFDIFESLDNYTLTAEFFIADGIDMMENVPLGGEEIIEVTFQTPTRDTVTYEFLVESIQGLRTNETGNLKSYTLRCVTKDFLKNTFKVFTRRYRDLKYDDALNECITIDMASDVPLITVEKTKGVFDYVVNQVRPFQVINLIKERAVSGEGNISSAFVFYQDRDGYHFQTVEKLIKDRKPGAKSKEFFYDISNKTSDYEKVINWRNLLGFEVITQGSSVKKVKDGAIRNQFREFDIFRGTYYIMNEYVNPSDHKKFEATDDKLDFNSSSYNSFASELPAVTKLLVKDGLRPEMEHNKNVHFQRAFMQRMVQYGVRVKAYGDTGIKVGDIVKLSLQQVTGTTQAPEDAKLFRENYIVVNLKHTLEQRSDSNFEHFLVMDLVKPNQYGKELG